MTLPLPVGHRVVAFVAERREVVQVTFRIMGVAALIHHNGHTSGPLDPPLGEHRRDRW